MGRLFAGFCRFMVAIVQGGLIRDRHTETRTKALVFVGLMFYTIGFFLFAIATKGWMMFLFVVPFAMGGFCRAGFTEYHHVGCTGETNRANYREPSPALISLTSIFGPFDDDQPLSVFFRPQCACLFPPAPRS